MDPKVVSLRDLITIVYPHVIPYVADPKAAIMEIHDLHQLGAPVPNQIVRAGHEIDERRILLPSRFAKWWGEVTERAGVDAPSARDILRGLN